MKSIKEEGGKSKELKLCGFCEKNGVLKFCGKCQKVFYCNVSCQEKDWEKHKKVCPVDERPKNPLEWSTDDIAEEYMRYLKKKFGYSPFKLSEKKQKRMPILLDVHKTQEIRTNHTIPWSEDLPDSDNVVLYVTWGEYVEIQVCERDTLLNQFKKTSKCNFIDRDYRLEELSDESCEDENTETHYKEKKNRVWEKDLFPLRLSRWGTVYVNPQYKKDLENGVLHFKLPKYNTNKVIGPDNVEYPYCAHFEPYYDVFKIRKWGLKGNNRHCDNILIDIMVNDFEKEKSDTLNKRTFNAVRQNMIVRAQDVRVGNKWNKFFTVNLRGIRRERSMYMLRLENFSKVYVLPNKVSLTALKKGHSHFALQVVKGLDALVAINKTIAKCFTFCQLVSVDIKKKTAEIKKRKIEKPCECGGLRKRRRMENKQKPTAGKLQINGE